LDGEELFDEKFENIEGTAAGPCIIESRIKLLLSLLVECLNIVDGDEHTMPIGSVLVEPEVGLLEDGKGSKEALKGGSSSGNGLNEKGLDDICGVVNVGDTEDRVLRGIDVRLGITSHTVMSDGIPLIVAILLCGILLGVEEWSSIGELREGGAENPTLYE
jgi:hypothetical protein